MYDKSQIFILDDVISDKMCDVIKLIIDKTKGTIEDYKEASNVKAKSVTIGDIPDTQTVSILDTEVYKIVNKIANKIRYNNTNIKIKGDSGYQFRKIHGPTRIHSDGVFSGEENLSNIRSASLVIALNGDYKGGEFCFPQQNFKIKLKIFLL